MQTSICETDLSITSPQATNKKKTNKLKDQTILFLSKRILDELKTLINVIDNWIKEEDSKIKLRNIFVESRAVE